MAAGGRSGRLLRGCWSHCLVQRTGAASSTVLPVCSRLAMVMQPRSVKSIHCGNRPALQAEEPPGGPVSQRPEYIPQRKAKNPMGKIGLAWLIGLPSGIITFLLAKREVDKNRLNSLRPGRGLKSANEGDYQSERYADIWGSRRTVL
ncbi:DUF4748 domain-containing protein [Pristis pectinata]|uniref:DUF4748 domain-containing protein n=1 Tax=Pristis pectinata TaxID=685728 RepID=UPI00223D116F|nr:DUF4748 domain-containing protein [Pristis pectinata]